MALGRQAEKAAPDWVKLDASHLSRAMRPTKPGQQPACQLFSVSALSSPRLGVAKIPHARGLPDRSAARRGSCQGPESTRGSGVIEHEIVSAAVPRPRQFASQVDACCLDAQRWGHRNPEMMAASPGRWENRGSRTLALEPEGWWISRSSVAMAGRGNARHPERSPSLRQALQEPD